MNLLVAQQQAPRGAVVETPVLSDVQQRIFAEARRLLGTPYEINLPGFPRQPGRGLGKQVPPDGGIDCSGYVLQAFKAGGLLLSLDPLYTSVNTLWANSRPLAREDTQPCDLVVFRGTYATPGLSHVGIVVEPGCKTMLNARQPRASRDALDQPYWLDHLAGFCRPRGL